MPVLVPIMPRSPLRLLNLGVFALAGRHDRHDAERSQLLNVHWFKKSLRTRTMASMALLFALSSNND
jgi:hypothetical protein